MSGIALAANNGEVGGGEVMLLATARLLTDLGHEIEVVGPDAPEGRDGVLDLAESEGYPVHRLSSDRRRYLHELRDWHGGRRDLLWCHGLVPAFATAGRPRRVVHLHKLPSRTQHAGYLAARSRSWLTLVPSRWMSSRVPNARVLPNWTPDLGYAPRPPGSQRRLGYLGRHAVDKGLVVLAEALEGLDTPTPVQLVLAGEPRFTDEAGARRVADAVSRLGGQAESVGWVEPAALLRDVDGLVVPSVVPESFGLAAAEAMAAGVPCIVSDAGALPEVVGADHPWVVPAGDPAALAGAVRAWASASPARLVAVAREQRDRWEVELSPDVARERLRLLLAALPA
ncbi:MAG TPA: glycosyltransferase family 4 protein [Ornithinibacter sp.]|nr:glycosyltransferase family 4 protein [Ornithinibacter sp.]